VSQCRLEPHVGAVVAVAKRFQAHPPPAVARRVRLERDDLEAVQGPDRAAASRLFLSHDLHPP
jgi:hypothetical protein